MNRHSWYDYYPSEIPHNIDTTKLLCIYATIKKTMDIYSNQPALSCMGKTITFNELDKLVLKCAKYLQLKSGINKGHRIAIMLPNILQFPILFLAAQKIGAVCVNTNPLYTPREMLHQFNDSEVNTIIIIDLFLDKLEKIIDQTQITTIISTGIGDLLNPVKSKLISLMLKKSVPKHKLHVIPFKKILSEKIDQPLKEVDIDLDDLALIQYTGGTTGISKGAMLTHKNIASNIMQIKYWAKSCLKEGGETALAALPLYHIYALTVNFLTLLSYGAHVVLVPKPIPIINTVKIFKKYKISVIIGINTLFNAFNQNHVFKTRPPKFLKFSFAGGMLLQEQVLREWKKNTGTSITQGFGLTEASPVALACVPNKAFPLGSIGIPLSSTEAKIVDESGKEVEDGKEGELIIRGPQVMKGYWKNPEETENSIKDGWLYTGDIAKKDHKGFFYIVDRKKDMIIVSGFNVFPNEIEDLLVKHPKILEAAVIGIKDVKSNEVPKAFIVRKDPTLTEEEIRKYCKENLTNYKRPKFYEFRRSLPKSNIGKILRKELK